jgi:cation transport ATPase
VLAWVAALALLVFTAMDWWGTVRGDELRQEQKSAVQQGPISGEIPNVTRDDARIAAQGQEKNAWQAGHLVDKLILALLLATVAAATFAAMARAGDRRFEPPWTPSALAAALALLTALLIAYRIANEPGIDSITTVKLGTVLSLCAATFVAVGAGIALQREIDGRAYKDLPEPGGNGRTPSGSDGDGRGPSADGDGGGREPRPTAGTAG